MAQNLSVPLAFVALLHLANEKVSVYYDLCYKMFKHFGWVFIGLKENYTFSYTYLGNKLYCSADQSPGIVEENY